MSQYHSDMKKADFKHFEIHFDGFVSFELCVEKGMDTNDILLI